MSALLEPARVGLRLKQLVLGFGAVFLGIVALTNLLNLVSAATTPWDFLNSDNTAYVASVVGVYSMPDWFDELAVAGAFVVEATGAALFVRALLRYRGGGSGVVEAFQALAWNVGVWCAFILGTEFFVAYGAEGVFRELLALALLMAVVLAVVPDDVRRTEPAT
jgi:hypothetical protein